MDGDGEAHFETSLPPSLGGIELLSVPYGGEEVGVIRERTAGTYTAAMAVRPGAFALRDRSEQERVLDGWGEVLSSCARDGSPVRRLQWIEQTVPALGDDLAAHFQRHRDRAVPLDSDLVRSYVELVERSAPQTHEHEILLAVQISERQGARELRRLGGGEQAACELVLREAEGLAERLALAEVSVLGLLRPRQYAGLIRDAFDPFGRRGRVRAALGEAEREGIDPELMGPLATEESWSRYRSDSAWHTTYWIASWPRSEVGPLFLAPLLMQTQALRSVAVTIEPVPYSLAMRRGDGANGRGCRGDQPKPPGLSFHGAKPPPRRSGVTARGGACRRPCARSLRRVRADGGAGASCTRTHRERGRARRCSGTSWPATPPRRAGSGLSQHPATGKGLDLMLRLGERPGHSATTAHACAAFPFLAQGRLPAGGVYIGRDLYGGGFSYDPWLLYPRVLQGSNMLILGGLGSRKSSLLKTYIYRQILHGRQAWVLDVKGEFAPLAAALGRRPIALQPGGEVRLNPIERHGGRDGQLSLLRSVAQAALRRELGPEEDAGLRVALDQVNEECRDEEPTLPMVVNALLHPREAMVQAVSAADTECLAASVRQTALALQRLCAGDLRGMFDGSTSEGLDLEAPLVVIDLSAVRDSAAVAILMACAGAWQQAILAERKRAAEEEGLEAPKLISGTEEGWRLTSNTGAAEWLLENWKLCRGWGVQNIVVTHRVSDLGRLGCGGQPRGADRGGSSRRHRYLRHLPTGTGSSTCPSLSHRPGSHGRRTDDDASARRGGVGGRSALLPRLPRPLQYRAPLRLHRRSNGGNGPPGGGLMSGESGLYLSLAALVAGLLAVVWAWGTLAGILFGSGWDPIPPSALVGVALRLPSELGDPRAAWPQGANGSLPAPPGFYTAGVLLLAGLAGIVVAAGRVLDSLDMPAFSRRPRRAPAARWANGRDLARLAVRRGEPTRLTLGQAGRRLLAARERESVIVFGPTGTHKTSGLAIPALLEWEGPVLATTVKSDLVGVTLARREALGKVMIFDPAQVTGLATARATPLHRTATWAGALEVAHWLASAARSGAGGLHDADFWYAAAEKLLAPLLFAAASSALTMEAVVSWLDEGAEAIAVDVEAILTDSGEQAALRAWRATQNREERQRSSIYTTAEMIVAAFADPRVIEETSDADYTPARLLDGGANTLYLCAPRQQQDRLRPLFATFVQELMAEVEVRELRTRRPLDPPLLLLLDECANIAPPPGLDEIASTARGLGVQLLTIFQDLSQVRARWGNRADSIVNNHGAKVICMAISDTPTLEYVSRLLGSGEFEQRSTSTSSGERGRHSETHGETHRDLAPPNVIRERKPGTALLIDAELPPAQIKLRPWYEDRALRSLRYPDERTA